MSDAPTTPDATDAEATEVEEAPYELTLAVEINDIGPCKKHVKVTMPRADVEHHYGVSLEKFAEEANVPGFRTGHVPSKLVEKRFKKELGDQVKQDLLMESLEQVSEEHGLQAIDQPEMDIESIELPEEGDFTYEFDVEVRPEFDLPDYSGLKLERPTREVTDEDVAQSKERYLSQYASLDESDAAIEADDIVALALKATHNGEEIRKVDDFQAHVKPVLRFVDAELEGFAELLAGKATGQTVTTEVTVSPESPVIEKRGETVALEITINGVHKQVLPEMTGEFLEKLGFDSEEDLDGAIRQSLERQTVYEQRQSTRKQVLDKITASADWDLPENLVLKQVDNAMRREILEMQQAGFTPAQIRARENEMQQQAVSETRQALKEHFVLDKIATEENIEVTPSDLESEIMQMAWSRGENPRRVRARLQKSGMIENLEAQIRERKAVDVILDKAEFTDVDLPRNEQADNVEAVRFALCQQVTEASPDEEEDGEQAGRRIVPTVAHRRLTQRDAGRRPVFSLRARVSCATGLASVSSDLASNQVRPDPMAEVNGGRPQF